MLGLSSCNHQTQKAPQKDAVTSAQVKKDTVKKDYKVIEYPTPNVSPGVNEVKGIVLHHTATADAQEALEKMTTPGQGVSAHVLIDTDGTRYLLAPPDAITWHAGKSRLKNRENANNFTVGIEFQGNTVDKPLTDDQIQSALDYIIPIMEKYHLSADDIVTHEEIRADYLNHHPDSDVLTKVDVTPAEKARLLAALQERMR